MTKETENKNDSSHINELLYMLLRTDDILESLVSCNSINELQNVIHDTGVLEDLKLIGQKIKQMKKKCVLDSLEKEQYPRNEMVFPKIDTHPIPVVYYKQSCV